MRKKIFEAKADIESGIAKALADAPLDHNELDELSKISHADLIKDHGLDYSLSELVVKHVEIEMARIATQEQNDRTALEESIRKKFRLKNRKEKPEQSWQESLTDFTGIS